MKIISDIDGVISTIHPNWIIDDIMYKYFGSYWGWFRHYNCKVIMKPQVEITLITGRPETDRWYTEKWLKKNDIQYTKLIMNDTGSMDEEIIARYKAQFIKYNIFDLYYDDSILPIIELKCIMPINSIRNEMVIFNNYKFWRVEINRNK